VSATRFLTVKPLAAVTDVEPPPHPDTKTATMPAKAILDLT